MFGNRNKLKPRPSGVIPDSLALKLLEENHVLIGGTTGSGKSTMLDTLLYNLCTYTPEEKSFCVIDLKRISLLPWKRVPHCRSYAINPPQAQSIIMQMVDIVERRYTEMEKSRLRTYNGSDLYLVIDEAADLLNNPAIPKKVSNNILGSLTHICRVGRACKCHVIYCSQQVARSVIPSSIQANCNGLVGLRCRSKMESRMIIGQAGCEMLPRYGHGYLFTPDMMQPELVDINMTSPDVIENLVNYWTN